jgi:hypothetical protein
LPCGRVNRDDTGSERTARAMRRPRPCWYRACQHSCRRAPHVVAPPCGFAQCHHVYVRRPPPGDEGTGTGQGRSPSRPGPARGSVIARVPCTRAAPISSCFSLMIADLSLRTAVLCPPPPPGYYGRNSLVAVRYLARAHLCNR